MTHSEGMTWLYSVAFGFTGGVFLSLVFFLGLWATIQRIILQQAGAMLFISSFIVRTGFILIGFFFVLKSLEWQGLVSAIAAFTMVRILLAQVLTLRMPNSCNVK